MRESRSHGDPVVGEDAAVSAGSDQNFYKARNLRIIVSWRAASGELLLFANFLAPFGQVLLDSPEARNPQELVPGPHPVP